MKQIQTGCLKNRSGILETLNFHAAGIICLVWFLFRIIPKPNRISYPCQQANLSLLLSYLAFWHSVGSRTSRFFHHHRPYSLFLMMGLTGIMVCASGSLTSRSFGFPGVKADRWIPVPCQPVGTPVGEQPGRVVWMWDPDLTGDTPTGYWWDTPNNNQDIMDEMVSIGIRWTAGVNGEYDAWDHLFRYYNQTHGLGDIGYQPGQKICIKVNMNNTGVSAESYTSEDGDIDGNPYLMKSILRQLVNVAGVSQDDITIFDATKTLANWYFNRIYYEVYPASPLVPEFPNVHYADILGGTSGREPVQASTVDVHYAYGSGLSRTLPTCVTTADYLINIPSIKRHISTNVTLSGKNHFGSCLGPANVMHPYWGQSNIMGNRSPHVDNLAHEHLGGKTFLYIGDATYGSRTGDNVTVTRFQMYPFNNDWMSSLFFSQDPCALDSVMYDFLLAEGTNPSEGSQNYLHQAADPPPNTYDPEDDGIFLSESLGVHEHWDTGISIFSPDRYSGPTSSGIDYVPDPDEPPENPQPTPTQTPDCSHHGDVTLDGNITAGDAQLAFQITLGSHPPTYEEECAADCNSDNAVTAGDAQAIFMAVLGTGECADQLVCLRDNLPSCSTSASTKRYNSIRLEF